MSFEKPYCVLYCGKSKEKPGLFDFKEGNNFNTKYEALVLINTLDKSNVIAAIYYRNTCSIIHKDPEGIDWYGPAID